MSCPYDTDGDRNCHACSRPGWRCNGEHPEQLNRPEQLSGDDG